MAFLDALAWVFGVLSSVVLALRLLAAWIYFYTETGKMEQLVDACNGRRRSLTFLGPFIVTVICWLWVIYGR